MSDRYLAFANSTTGRRLVGALGLPAPLRLERWTAGRVRPVDGALLLGGEGALADAASAVLNKLTDQSFAAEEGRFGLPRWTAEHGPKLKALVFDASGLTRFEQLIELRGSQLRDAVQVLAADFGFKDAVASGDGDTIRSALANHGARINADAVLLLALDGTLESANEAALSLLGVPQESVVGAPFWQTPWWSHSKEQQALVRLAFQAVIQGESRAWKPPIRIRMDSSTRWIFTLSPCTTTRAG